MPERHSENLRSAAEGLLSDTDGAIHFVGIGGVGMAGLAWHLHRRGRRVTGTDRVESRVTHWLREEGLQVGIGHGAEALPAETRWLVRTPAVSDENAEVRAARERGLQVLARGTVLPALLAMYRGIAVAGTHGKTTTSALILHLLEGAGLSPSGCIGGELDGTGAVARGGAGDWFVAEADESDGTLARYGPDIGLITNIEFDHMDYFPDEAAFRACFEQFAAATRNLLLVRYDDPVARAIGELAPRVLSLGAERGADVYVDTLSQDEEGSMFALWLHGRDMGRFRVPLPGSHNVWNAAAAVAVALECGAAPNALADALPGFRGVRRRYEVVVDSRGIVVISDYAHHPTEIRAVLDAARRRRRRMVAIYQPHRYTRTRTLAEAFPAAFDGLAHLVLAPVYAASEAPLPGGTSRDLLARFDARRHVPVELADSLDDAWARALASLRDGDILLVLGAGDVERLAVTARERWGASSNKEADCESV